jgi:thiamine-phosphate pyrophosphorylase
MSDPRARLARARLYLLATRSLCRGPFEETLRLAIAGGVDIVQLREKEIGDEEFCELAGEVGALVRGLGALFIVNDRIRAANLADGVHLGQDDLGLAEAREILGPAALIGISTHDEAQARDAERNGADYVGVGPTFPTGTKDTGYDPRGPARIGAISAGLGIPAFAIGGITPENAPLLCKAGVTRIALSSAILTAPDPWEMARRMTALLV